MNKKILGSLALVTLVLAATIGGTIAYFSDTETSENNTFTAGAIDLKVDSQAHYNGMVCTEVSEGVFEWQPELSNGDSLLVAKIDPAQYPQPGDPCVGTWELRDLESAEKPVEAVSTAFFDYRDLKPGDHGENTISLHVFNNDAYMCAVIDNMEDTENGITEPEGDGGDVSEELGELSSQLRFFAWEDDGNNIWEENERFLFSNQEGPASDVLDGVVYPMYTPSTEAIPGDVTKYIGIYWCFGDITVGEYTLDCDGSEVNNLTQTDGLKADISFVVEQARHNSNFACPTLKEEPTRYTNTLSFNPTGWAGWSCPLNEYAVGAGVLSGDGNTYLWEPGASAGAVSYPSTPFGYTYGDGETGMIIQNDGDGNESITYYVDCLPKLPE